MKNKQIKDKPKFPEKTIPESLSRIKKESNSLKLQFEALVKDRNSAQVSFNKLIQNQNILLKPNQIQSLQINTSIAENYETQLIQLTNLFQKELSKKDCNITILISINKLFIKKLNAYNKILNAHKEFSKKISSEYFDNNEFTDEINQLLQELEQ